MNKDHLCLVKFSNKHNIYLKSILLLEPYIYGGTNGSFYTKSPHCYSCIPIQERMRAFSGTAGAVPFAEKGLMRLGETDYVPRGFA